MPLALSSATMRTTTCACCSGGAHKATVPRAHRSSMQAACRLNSRRPAQKAEARRQRLVFTHAAATEGEAGQGRSAISSTPQTRSAPQQQALQAAQNASAPLTCRQCLVHYHPVRGRHGEGQAYAPLCVTANMLDQLSASMPASWGGMG